MLRQFVHIPAIMHGIVDHHKNRLLALMRQHPHSLIIHRDLDSGRLYVISLVQRSDRKYETVISHLIRSSHPAIERYLKHRRAVFVTPRAGRLVLSRFALNAILDQVGLQQKEIHLHHRPRAASQRTGSRKRAT